MKLTGKDIDIICRYDMDNEFLASLISSDNIHSIKDAEKSLDFINEVENALKTASVSSSKKLEFENYIKKGRKILNKEIDKLKQVVPEGCSDG